MPEYLAVGLAALLLVILLIVVIITIVRTRRTPEEPDVVTNTHHTLSRIELPAWKSERHVVDKGLQRTQSVISSGRAVDAPTIGDANTSAGSNVIVPFVPPEFQPLPPGERVLHDVDPHHSMMHDVDHPQARLHHVDPSFNKNYEPDAKAGDDDAMWDIDLAIHHTGVRWSDDSPPQRPQHLPGQVQEVDEATQPMHFEPPPPSPSAVAANPAAYIDPYPTLDRKDSVVARAQARLWKPSGGNLAAVRGRQRSPSIPEE